MTAQELVGRLQPHGYTITLKVGSHIVMKNPKAESIISIPTTSKGQLRQSTITAIRKNVVEKGVMSEKEFIKIVR